MRRASQAAGRYLLRRSATAAASGVAGAGGSTAYRSSASRHCGRRRKSSSRALGALTSCGAMQRRLGDIIIITKKIHFFMLRRRTSSSRTLGAPHLLRRPRGGAWAGLRRRAEAPAAPGATAHLGGAFPDRRNMLQAGSGVGIQTASLAALWALRVLRGCHTARAYGAQVPRRTDARGHLPQAGRASALPASSGNSDARLQQACKGDRRGRTCSFTNTGAGRAQVRQHACRRLTSNRNCLRVGDTLSRTLPDTESCPHMSRCCRRADAGKQTAHT